VVVAGCGRGGNAYFPMGIGSEWTYSVSGKLSATLAKSKCTKRVAVGGELGYRLEGTLGDSKVLVQGDVVKAGELGGTRYLPPITLLDASKIETLKAWRGTAIIGGKPVEASADITQREQSYTQNGRKIPAILVTTVLKYGDKEIESSALYAKGLGLVEQTHRVNGSFASRIEYQSGP
jgi:hypothetical protein